MFCFVLFVSVNIILPLRYESKVLSNNIWKLLLNTLVLSIKIKFSSLMIPDALLPCRISSWSEENCNMWQTQQRDRFQILSRVLKNGNNILARKKQYTRFWQQSQAQPGSTLFLHLHFQLCFRMVIVVDLRGGTNKKPLSWAINLCRFTQPYLQHCCRI